MPLLSRLPALSLACLAALVVLEDPASAAGTATSRTPAARDDYPYRHDTTGAADRWGFSRRQCVSFAAWRLAQQGTPVSAAAWGSALRWDDAARRAGRRISARPVVGAVAQWNAGERSAYYSPGATRPSGTITASRHGHVGVVRTVYADGSVQLEQYNLRGDRRWAVARLTAPRYLYIGVRG